MHELRNWFRCLLKFQTFIRSQSTGPFDHISNEMLSLLQLQQSPNIRYSLDRHCWSGRRDIIELPIRPTRLSNQWTNDNHVNNSISKCRLRAHWKQYSRNWRPEPSSPMRLNLHFILAGILQKKMLMGKVNNDFCISVCCLNLKNTK